MFTNNHFRRRVHISHRRGGIDVRIERQNSRGVYFGGMCFCAAFYIVFCDFLFGGGRRQGVEFLTILLMSALGLAGYAIALAICVWGAFGIEELRVEAGALRWTRTALKWSRTRNIPVGDITDIKAVTPWHGMDNTVELVTSRERQTIGDKLLHDEATELAHRLRGAVGLLK